MMIFNICLVICVLIILCLIINEETKQKKRHNEISKKSWKPINQQLADEHAKRIEKEILLGSKDKEIAE